MRLLSGSISLVATLFASSAALAQPLPGFGTIDRFDEQTKVAASMSYTGFDDGFFEDLTALRFDLFGQYMTPGGFGGYAMIPFDYLSFMDQSESGQGNLELGGLYVVPGDMPLVLRGGLSLDTADADTGAITLFTRLTDFPSKAPNTTWLRLSASLLKRSGTAFFRVDGGLDAPIDDDDQDIDPLVRLNLGGGVETGGVALMGELVTLGTTDQDGDYTLGERFIHTAAVTGRYIGGGNFQPHMTLSLPLDDDTTEILDYIIIVGFEYVIPTSTGPLAPAGDAPPPPPGAY